VMRFVVEPAQLSNDRGIAVPTPALQPVDQRRAGAAFTQRGGCGSEDRVSRTELLEERAQARGVQPGRANQSEPGRERGDVSHEGHESHEESG
jgi:hypothetical protein